MKEDDLKMNVWNTMLFTKFYINVFVVEFAFFDQ